ncbi:PREDICTED: uncharacterized protein LOC109229962 [Nicotiana attenuata]|uniref:uncharacterized protein LOC109229962 n=1 Tax=Nicotiana attenuata TaxID=49451 RepID=UPI000905868C|nr:PREDICTED: uncharacterized protein LOC109229962 [Nicotiana attenuata]
MCPGDYIGGTKARDVNGYKLWYSRDVRGKNGVGILVDRDLRELVVDVRRANDRLLIIKLVVNVFTFNVISAYAPQAGLSEEVKRFSEEGRSPGHIRSRVARTQIDYLLLRRGDTGLCTNCKVIPSECLSTQHRLMVMDLEVKGARKKRPVYDQPKIKWGALTKGKAQELGEKPLAMGA